MIITIEGRRGEGKSRMAMQIVGDAKSVNIEEYELVNNLASKFIEEDTKFIIIDEIISYKKTVNAAKLLLKSSNVGHIILVKSSDIN